MSVPDSRAVSAGETRGRAMAGFVKFSEGKAGAVVCAVLLGAALAFAAGVHLRAPVLPYDDAFITCHYAENLLAGKGLVYNEGERVYGYSTVTYLFWLALLKCLMPGADLPALAVRGNFLPFAAAGLAVFFLLRKVTGSRLVAALAAAAILVHPSMLAVSIGGMESFLFIAAALFACLALAEGRPLWAGTLAGLAVLTRPEGVLLVPLVIIAFRQSRRNLALSAAAFAVPTAAWAVVALAYYGTVVPLPILAKMKPLYAFAPGTALARIAGDLDTTLSGKLLGPPRLTSATLVLVLLAAGSIACLAYRPCRRSLGWACPVLFWALLAFYSCTNPMVFPWYWPPILVTALLTVVTGAWAAANLAEQRLERSGHPATAPRLAGAVLVSALAWLVTVTALCYTIDKPGNAMAFQKQSEDAVQLRILSYREAAERLNGVLAPDDRVVAAEVGTLGYYLNGKVIDACGLVSPEAHPYLPVPPDQKLDPTVGAISADLIRAIHPEWVVTLPLFGARSINTSPWFQAHYRRWMVLKLPKPCWGSDELHIYRRVP